MATNIPGQLPELVAKDILIAALEAERVSVDGTNAKEQGESLAQMYNAILTGIKERTS